MSVRAIEAEVSIKSGVSAECTIGREVVVEVHEEAVLEPLTVTANGNYEPSEGVDGYDRVVVDVPPTIPDISPLTVTEDGVYTSSGDGYNPVTVNTGVGALRQEIASAETASGCNPLVDGLAALTTYANEVTGAEDTTLSDAVETLASKYGKAEFNIARYLADCNGLFKNTILPETVELDFDGNTTFTTFSNAFYKTSGVKHIVIKNLVSSATNIAMDNFLYVSPDVTDLTFENCDFTTKSLESFGRSCPKLKAIYGEIDCSRIGSGNGLSFWGGGSNIEFRIKPNTINFGREQANFGGQVLAEQTIVSIANGLNPSVVDQSLYLSNNNKPKLYTIMGYNDAGMFVADENGALSLADFITTVKGWGIG